MLSRDDILWLALKAGFEMDDQKRLYTKDGDGLCAEELQRFAGLVAAAEREACARVCDRWCMGPAEDAAFEIRARGNK